jgi:hypothetical protein
VFEEVWWGLISLSWSEGRGGLRGEQRRRENRHPPSMFQKGFVATFCLIRGLYMYDEIAEPTISIHDMPAFSRLTEVIQKVSKSVHQEKF